MHMTTIVSRYHIDRDKNILANRSRCSNSKQTQDVAPDWFIVLLTLILFSPLCSNWRVSQLPLFHGYM